MLKNKIEKIRQYNWPIIVLIFIAFGIALGTWTINVAVSNPVQLADDYMQEYQQVDMNIEKIRESKKRFNAKYTVNIERKILALGQPETVTLSVAYKDGKNASSQEGLLVDVLVTRPHTKTSDIMFENIKAQNGIYTIGPFTLNDKGRWQVYARVSVGKDIGFKKLEYHVK